MREAARHVASKKIGAVPVVEGTRLVGVFSERDLVTRVVAPGLDASVVTIGQVMTRDVVIAKPEDTYEVVLERMMRGHIRHLPVVSNGRLVGFVSFRGLVLQDVALKGAAPKMLSTAVHLTAATVGALRPSGNATPVGIWRRATRRWSAVRAAPPPASSSPSWRSNEGGWERVEVRARRIPRWGEGFQCVGKE